VTRRGLLGLLAAGLGASVLSACGRKGKPEQPEDSTFPTTYPYTPYPTRKSTPAPDTDQTR